MTWRWRARAWLAVMLEDLAQRLAPDIPPTVRPAMSEEEYLKVWGPEEEPFEVAVSVEGLGEPVVRGPFDFTLTIEPSGEDEPDFTFYIPFDSRWEPEDDH